MSSWALSTAWLQLYKWEIKDLDEPPSIFRQSREYCAFQSVHTCIYIFEKGVWFLIWMAWVLFGFMAVYWKITCNDIVLLTPTVDVTDANVCYSFPEFDMQVACSFLSFCLICFCRFVSHLPSCFKRYFCKMESIHCYKWNEIYLKRDSI